ncbi:porin [Burkholderia sp. Ac-20379]|uniref:porin n=1 Tax=Burkholderia sp. Ac-20379 TaxID=2703900 RepID=UPI00197D7A9A|nr:porin [Burkholderia sp. Ac-20379]MBN3725192.1 porin [Burkholderia sp. Ac-20379]
MLKKMTTVAALAAFGTTLAHAQSSVTLYGVIDTGLSYVNHAAAGTGSAKRFKYDDGVAQGTRWGLRGSEDLGGGLKAIFLLENGFNTGTGVINQGGAMFGRQAYVGLTKDGIGALTFGRQYTFSTDVLGGQYSAGTNTLAGNYAYHINDFDQLVNSRINNAVKFSSANFSGVTFGALYGFSNQAGAFAGSAPVGGSTGSSRAYSFGLNYAMGGFSVGAAYTDISYPTAEVPAFPTSIANVNAGGTGGGKDLRTFGIGTRYQFANAALFALYTNTRIEALNGAATSLDAVDVGGRYNFTTALAGGLAYTYTRMHNANGGHWNQIDASLDYALSKRTDVYLVGVYQKASGRNGTQDVQAQIGSSTAFFGPSGNGATNQIAARVGIRHKF